MDAVTPARAVSAVPGSLCGDHLFASFAGRSPWSAHSTFRPFCLQPPAPTASCQGTLPLGRSHQERFSTGQLPTRTRGFPTALQARHWTPAESSFCSYGRVVHLRQLTTPSHDDAVAFSYWFTLNQRGLSPLWPSALLQAHRAVAAATAFRSWFIREVCKGRRKKGGSGHYLSLSPKPHSLAQ